MLLWESAGVRVQAVGLGFRAKFRVYIGFRGAGCRVQGFGLLVLGCFYFRAAVCTSPKHTTRSHRFWVLGSLAPVLSIGSDSKLIILNLPTHLPTHLARWPPSYRPTHTDIHEEGVWCRQGLRSDAVLPSLQAEVFSQGRRSY